MKLIAKKPCSFGGRDFYINDEIPPGLVADAALQERMGMLAVVADPPGSSSVKEELFTAEQVEEMIARAAAEAREEYEQEIFGGASEGVAAEGIVEADMSDTVTVPVTVKEDGDSAEMMAVPLTRAEVQKVFSIMQMVVPDAEKAVSEVTGENVLIVLHACDSRAGVKKAARKRADTLFPVKQESSAVQDGNGAAGDHEEAETQPAG